MSYNTQADLATDSDFLIRVIACAATQNIAQPERWVTEHKWELSAQPGWDEAYAYAIDTKVSHPGAQIAVISDAMILAGVQAITAKATPAS
jgi:hypothetical protein